MTLPPFPNSEAVLVTDLAALAAGRWQAGGVTPPDLEAQVPFVRVRRIGGPSDNVNDYPFVTLEVWAATYAEAVDIAEEIRAHLLGGHISTVHGQIDRTVCTSAHVELPVPEGSLLRLITTTYRCTLRRLTTAA